MAVVPIASRWRSLPRATRIAAVVVPMLWLAAWLYQPYVHNGLTLCWFRLLTGLPCPGCGLTRSWCELSRGHVIASLTEHPLGIAIFAYTLWYVVARWTFVLTGRSLETGGRRLHQLAAAALVSVFLIRLACLVAQPAQLLAHLESGLIPGALLRLVR